MRKAFLVSGSALLLAYTLLATPLSAAPVLQDEMPPAPIENDEGGAIRIVGIGDYTDFSIPVTLRDAAPTLLDMVHVVEGDPTQFSPVESQILGKMTSPVAPSPLNFAFDLPIMPTATMLDVDNDGEEDDGVQIFRVAMGANLNVGSHLEQLDQLADLDSLHTDPITGDMISGSLLLWAPDDAQGFPGDFGDDGVLFTEDDPAVAIPAGYTVVHFGPDGFTFDRSAEAELDVVEEPSAESPDFSDQGVVESFNSLIDHLAQRYSFTELRNLDWEAIRATYLPQIEQAEALVEQNEQAAAALYSLTLHTMAQTIRDAHVASVIVDPAYGQAGSMVSALEQQPIALNLGVNTAELSDGRIIVTDIVTGSPAAEAGWTFGTQIIGINGIPVDEVLPGVIYNETTGTDESQRILQVRNVLNFPAPDEGPAAEVTIEALVPGASEAESFALTPEAIALPNRLAAATKEMAIQYNFTPETNPSWGYLTWKNFEEPEVAMAVLRQFLGEANSAQLLSGVILDMRGNSGGWDNQYFTMASYFFDPENPVSMHWIDQDVWDEETQALVPQVGPQFLLSAPDPSLYYGGPLVVLIDNNCASSCEFFSQFLQSSGRATVVAEHASKGAGAPINRVALPLGSLFQYTKARAYFAGTDQLNLEGTGVVPDVRLPVTEETIQAEMAGGDPLLEFGVQTLFDLGGQEIVDSLTLSPISPDLGAPFTVICPEEWPAAPQGPMVGCAAPGNLFQLVYQIAPTTTVDAVLGQFGFAPAAESLIETYAATSGDWDIYAHSDANFTYHAAAMPAGDDSLYVALLAAPTAPSHILLEGVLKPALDAFAPVE